MVRIFRINILFMLLCVLVAASTQAADLAQELASLKQRKKDFEKDRVYMSEDPPLTRNEKVDLHKLLKERDKDLLNEKKIQDRYAQNREKHEGPDAFQREVIEQKIQDRDDERQVEKEKKFARIEERREQIVQQAHLEINGSQEYDIHIPKKENRAKARKPRSKK